MRPRRAVCWVLAALALGAAVSGCGSRQQQDDRARNVIFLHGDGMGASARDLIRLATKGHDDDLVMNELRYAGLVETDPDDPHETVTDSAAAATAYATGERTRNGGVGVDADGKRVPTLLEDARADGRATGLVTTAQVTDASPASFGAHVLNRAQESEIARQFLEVSKPDVILGGGEDHWLPPSDAGAYPDHPRKDPTEESSGDRGNLIARAERLGYEYVSDRAGLRRSRAGRVLGLFANEEMFEQRVEGDGDVYDPVVPLEEMTSKALSILGRDPDGFFLFVEEEGIDEFSHSNNTPKTIESGQALDRAVAVAVRFAGTHPGTLIIVTGDHATGGLAIENVAPPDESGARESSEDGPFTVAGSGTEFVVDWTSGGHTGESTPLTAEGPGAAVLARVQRNTDVHAAILRAMGG